MTKEDLDLFKSIADATGGLVLYFHGKSKKSAKALRRISSFITNGLIGGTNIPVIQTGRLRRSLGFTEYTITVDDSIDTLSVTTMTGTQESNIQLRNPGRHLLTALSSCKVLIFKSTLLNLLKNVDHYQSNTCF